MRNTLDAIATMIITGHVVDDIGYHMLEFSDSFRCHLHIPLLDKDYYTMFNADVHSYLRIEIRIPSAETALACGTNVPSETVHCAPQCHDKFVHSLHV
jgi:hypothetical protein